MRADRSKSAKIQRKADSKNGGQAKRNKKYKFAWLTKRLRKCAMR